MHSTAMRQVPGIVSKADGYMYNEKGTRLGREEDLGTGAEDLLQAVALEEFAGMHCSLSCHSFTLSSQVLLILADFLFCLGRWHTTREIRVGKQRAGELNKVCGAEAAEEKAAQEFKQRTGAGAGASDTKSVDEQVHFVALDEKTAPPSLLPFEQYIPDGDVIPTQWPGSVQERSWSGSDSERPIMLSDGIHCSPILSRSSSFCLTWHTLHGLP